MDATFFQNCDKTSPNRELARKYLGVVDSEQVRLALRRLRSDANLTPEEFADEAGVNRATVYRIEGKKKYAPRIETVSALAASRGLSLAAFFAKIEGVEVPNQEPEKRTAHPVISALDRIAEKLSRPAAKGTTVLTIPFELDEAERTLVIETAVDVVHGRPSARTESRRPHRPATTPKQRKQA